MKRQRIFMWTRTTCTFWRGRVLSRVSDRCPARCCSLWKILEITSWATDALVTRRYWTASIKVSWFWKKRTQPQLSKKDEGFSDNSRRRNSCYSSSFSENWALTTHDDIMAKRIEVIKSVSSVATRKTRIIRQEELSCLSFFQSKVWSLPTLNSLTDGSGDFHALESVHAGPSNLDEDAVNAFRYPISAW